MTRRPLMTRTFTIVNSALIILAFLLGMAYIGLGLALGAVAIQSALRWAES